MRSLLDLDPSEGTVQLHTTASSTSSDKKDLVLHPRPSPTDPNDPLNWPRRKKHIAFAAICTFTFLTNFAIGGLAPAFYDLSIQYNRTQTETSALLLWPILVLGAFNFFWVPIANYVGKRPVFVFACLLLALCYLWGAVADSFESLLWSNIVAAFAGSATEAVAVSTVNDLYFLHERGNMMGWYLTAINGGNTIGPLICGFVITGTTWRWHKWIAFILTTINWICCVLFVPETRYDRSGGEAFAAPQASSTRSDLESSSAESDNNTPHSEKLTKITTSERQNTPQEQHFTLPKKSWKQELALWTGAPTNTTLLTLFLRPLPLIVYPAVILAFLGFAVSLAWVVAINILNPFVLQAPPYNWAPSLNGLINISGLIGNLLGAWGGGWVVDRYADWRSRKNGGVFQPETRLHLLVLPAVIVPAGCLAFGYGVARSLHWTALFFGNGMVSFGLTFVPASTMTYVSDCYLPINADALELVNGLKNIVAFGFLYGVIPWVTKAGYLNVFGTQAGIYVAIMLLAVPVVVFGRRLRHASARWKVIL